VLDLGEMPLANAFISDDRLNDDELRFPLELVFCNGCCLAQITETVRADLLFEHYLYASSYSDTALKHAEEIARNLTARLGLNGHSLVLEVASNDGYLLSFFQQLGARVLGIEPARNLAAIANERGISTRAEFFSEELARLLVDEGLIPDLIIGNNVLAHVADLNGFARGVALLLRDGGMAQFEFPYILDLVDRLEFDTIYHEHVFYFSVTAIEALFARHNLRLADAERIPIHGGSLRVCVTRQPDGAGLERVSRLLEEERKLGIDKSGFFHSFGKRVRAFGDSLGRLLADLRAQNKRIAAYGAAAKGAVLLNYLGLSERTIDYVVDRSPLKQGLRMPGTHQRVFPTERLIEDRPDYVLLLAWNFADEIVGQQQRYVESGGRFIIPAPEPAVCGGEKMRLQLER
jgi:SAM-dependent methyltransferase